MSRTGPARQRNVDTVVLCHYADDPGRRPHCTLTAVVRVGSTPLCATCHQARSTLGKGQPTTRLPAGRPVDVLGWVSDSHEQSAIANRRLVAAVTRARQAGHPWSAIGARLGISRQAAQQRFDPQRPSRRTREA
ncbi:MAG: hypothetical protein ACYCO3_13420 [Mycobacteriales bacterium]